MEHVCLLWGPGSWPPWSDRRRGSRSSGAPPHRRSSDRSTGTPSSGPLTAATSSTTPASLRPRSPGRTPEAASSLAAVTVLLGLGAMARDPGRRLILDAVLAAVPALLVDINLYDLRPT